MYENVKVTIEEAISKNGKTYTAVYLIFKDGKKVLAGFKDLAFKIMMANR